jgi:DNA-binding CsgD family transcriptional regulator
MTAPGLNNFEFLDAIKEIARLLDLSIKTSEAHRANLMERPDIHDVPGLVRLAIRARFVSSQA